MLGYFKEYKIMDRENFKRNIIYKSSKRGIKENDILLGNFVKENINKISLEEMKIYDKFLDENDIEIFNWISKDKKLPERYNHSFMIKLLM